MVVCWVPKLIFPLFLAQIKSSFPEALLGFPSSYNFTFLQKSIHLIKAFFHRERPIHSPGLDGHIVDLFDEPGGEFTPNDA